MHALRNYDGDDDRLPMCNKFVKGLKITSALCNTMSSQKIFDLGRPLIMGHRGDSSSAPENTILAIEQAVSVGIDFVETDLSMTKDNELILFHDDEPGDLERVTGHTGRIRDLTLEEVKELDIGHTFTIDEGRTFPFRGKGHTVLTVREFFEKFPDTRVNMDLKTDVQHASEILASLIKEYGREKTVIIGSFHDAQIDRFRILMPNVPTAASPSEVTKFVFGLKMRGLRLVVREPVYRAFQVPIKYGRIQVVDKRFIEAAHDRNIAVHVWTINEREEMENLIGLGVDGIFTDNPSLLRTVLAEKGFI